MRLGKTLFFSLEVAQFFMTDAIQLVGKRRMLES
jgi:hypothetical protein